MAIGQCRRCWSDARRTHDIHDAHSIRDIYDIHDLNFSMKQSAKRLLSMVFSLLFIIAAFVCFFDLVQPAYGTVQTLRGQLAGEVQSFNFEQAEVTQAQNLIDSHNQENQGTGSVGVAIPDGEDMAGAMAQAEGIAANNGVSITSIGVSAPGLARQSSPSAGPGQEPSSTEASSGMSAVKPLGNFSLNIAGSASYENFKSFLDQVETNIRIFDLKTLSLNPAPAVIPVLTGKNASGAVSSSSRDMFDYQMTLQTYYQLP
jgi:hypothetical protein